jgi:hypothetical protein
MYLCATPAPLRRNGSARSSKLSARQGKLEILARISDVKPTFFQDRLLSFSYKRPPKKLNIFVFETKFIIGTKNSLSDLKVFGPKAIGLFSFQIFRETTKSFVLFLEICELNPNVLVLFPSF